MPTTENKPTVGFISSAHFVDHVTGRTHPERPDRIRAITAAVRGAGPIASPDPFPNFHLDFGPFPETPLKVLELPEPVKADEQALRLVHPADHIERVRHLCEVGGGVLDQGDTPVCEHSYDIALLAVGALL